MNKPVLQKRDCKIEDKGDRGIVSSGLKPSDKSSKVTQVRIPTKRIFHEPHDCIINDKLRIAGSSRP